MLHDHKRYKISSRLRFSGDGVKGKISVLLIVLFLIFSSLFYFSPGFRSRVEQLGGGILYGAYSALNLFNESIINTKNTVVNYIHLEKKYRELQEENHELQSHEIFYLKIKQENEMLKRLFRYRPAHSNKIISAQIFSQSLGNYNDSARVSVGKENGIIENDVVVDGERLVGRVSQVGSASSTVMLITGPNSKVPVLFTSTHIKGILRGSSDGKLVLSVLNSNELMPNKDELVVTSGDGYYFPAGISVGIVTKSEGEDIEITPFFDIRKTHVVSILRD